MKRLCIALTAACAGIAAAQPVQPAGFAALGSRPPVYARDLKAPDDWKDETPPSDPLPELTPQERRAGYLFFARNPVSPSEVHHTPLRFEMGQDVAAFAALGEYEPVGFAVRPLEALEDAMLTISDMVGPEGRPLGRHNVDVRQAWVFRQATNRSLRTYVQYPLVLESAHPSRFDAGLTRHYWVTFYAPPDAAPGVYRGAATFTVRGRPSATRQITLRVLPFRLDSPGINYGIFYGLHRSWERVYAKDEVYPQNRTKHLIDQREHGMTHVTLMASMGLSFEGAGQGLRPVFDPAEPSEYYVSLEEEVRTAKEAGFDQASCVWVGNADVEATRTSILTTWQRDNKRFARELKEPHSWLFDRVYEAGIRHGIEVFRKAGMKEPYCFVVDESGNSEDRRKICDQYLEAVKRLGFRTILTINGGWIGLHLPSRYKGKLNVAVHNDIFGQSVLDQDRAAGVKEVWIYNIADRRNPYAARMRFGWYLLRIGATGAMQWVYQWPKKKGMYDDLTTNPRGAGEAFAYPSPEGPLPTLAWEGWREGVDDVRYVRTLERLCREKEDAMREAVAEARQDIQDMIAHFQVDQRGPLDPVSPDTAQKWRGRLAWHILRLLGQAR